MHLFHALVGLQQRVKVCLYVDVVRHVGLGKVQVHLFHALVGLQQRVKVCLYVDVVGHVGLGKVQVHLFHALVGLQQRVKVCFYIAQYPVRWTAQSALHFTTWQTCSFRHQLGFSGKHSSHAALRAKNIHSYFHHCL